MWDPCLFLHWRRGTPVSRARGMPACCLALGGTRPGDGVPSNLNGADFCCSLAAHAFEDGQPSAGGAPDDGNQQPKNGKTAAMAKRFIEGEVSATASLGFAHVNASSGGTWLQKDGRHSSDSEARASSKDDSPSGLSARDTARAAGAEGGQDAARDMWSEDGVRESHTPAPRRLSLMTGNQLRMSESESAIAVRLRSVPETPRSEDELPEIPTSASVEMTPSSPAGVQAGSGSLPTLRVKSDANKRSHPVSGGWDMGLLMEDGALRLTPRASLRSRWHFCILSPLACKVFNMSTVCFGAFFVYFSIVRKYVCLLMYREELVVRKDAGANAMIL